MKKKISEEQKMLLEIQAGQRYDHVKQDEKRKEGLNKWDNFFGYLSDMITKGK